VTASSDEVAVSAGGQVQKPRLAVVIGDDVAVVDAPASSKVLLPGVVPNSVPLHDNAWVLSWEDDGP
jgi:hypothetical protein